MNLDKEQRKIRITQITLAIVNDRISKGEVDPDNDEDLKRATIEAARIARDAYDDVQDFLK